MPKIRYCEELERKDTFVSDGYFEEEFHSVVLVRNDNERISIRIPKPSKSSEVTNFTRNGTTLTIHTSDGSNFPVTLPNDDKGGVALALVGNKVNLLAENGSILSSIDLSSIVPTIAADRFLKDIRKDDERKTLTFVVGERGNTANDVTKTIDISDLVPVSVGIGITGNGTTLNPLTVNLPVLVDDSTVKVVNGKLTASIKDTNTKNTALTYTHTNKSLTLTDTDRQVLTADLSELAKDTYPSNFIFNETTNKYEITLTSGEKLAAPAVSPYKVTDFSVNNSNQLVLKDSAGSTWSVTLPTNTGTGGHAIPDEPCRRTVKYLGYGVNLGGQADYPRLELTAADSGALIVVGNINNSSGQTASLVIPDDAPTGTYFDIVSLRGEELSMEYVISGGAAAVSLSEALITSTTLVYVDEGKPIFTCFRRQDNGFMGDWE